MLAERIKALRKERNMTQAELARLLGVTRSSVNAWEMGISLVSVRYIVELATIFKVSTDYLLGVESSVAINASGLSEQDIAVVQSLVNHLRSKNTKSLSKK